MLMKSAAFPPLFWFSSSRLPSPRPFWAPSREAIRRQGDCALHNVGGPLSNMVMSSSFFQFRCGSSCNTTPFDGNFKQDDMESDILSRRWKLEVPKRASNPSISFARMVPDLPNQTSSRGNSLSGASSADAIWRQEQNRLREAVCGKKKSSYTNVGISSGVGTGTTVDHGREDIENGIAYDSSTHVEDCYLVDFESTSRERALQSPFGQVCMGDDQINPDVLRLAHKPRNKSNDKSEGNANLVAGLINEDVASCMSGNAEVSLKSNNKKISDVPSKQHSQNSSQPNAQNGALRRSAGERKLADPLVPQISTPPHKPINQRQRFHNNGEGHDRVSNGHVLRIPASTTQKHRRKNNMTDNNASDPPLHYPREQELSSTQTSPEDIQPKGPSSGELLEEGGDTTDALQKDAADGNVVSEAAIKPTTVLRPDARKRLLRIYDKILVVDNISAAREIVGMLTNQYRHCVHACYTEVSNIDVKQETPVDHGEIICFCIYSGSELNFGDDKSCIWVDVLDGCGKSLLAEFALFFEDSSIKKVWHNYSFDKHVIQNYGFNVSGFHADTMHMARLWDSSRETDGGYSLEALTGDPMVCGVKNLIRKVSMETIFGRRKVKKDGSEGKIITIPPAKELQRKDRKQWICYSAMDAMSTLNLYENLKRKLSVREWKLDGDTKGSMIDFYEKYWRPFGELLVSMETDGMLVDRAYLAEIEKVAQAEQQVAANRFRSWASKYCPDAMYLNVGSDMQLRQLFFGGIQNRKDRHEGLPLEKYFKIPNEEKAIEEGSETPKKFRTIRLHRLPEAQIGTELYTASGWPSVSGDALKILAGKVSTEFGFMDESFPLQSDANVGNVSEDTESAYGTAYAAFGGGKEGKEACHAIAALCEVRSIDSLISNFILPLQGSHISGKSGRIHCSLNINTETMRLSTRRPNLQNQPALEKDRYKIRQAFIAAPGNSLMVADYKQLELRVLAHLANCWSMLDAFKGFKAGGDFHSRTAMDMYPHIREAVEEKHVLLEWHPQPGEENPPVPLLRDAFASERRKAKMLNFSIAYGKDPVGLARDWKVSVKEAKESVNRWYIKRQEVREWQGKSKKEAYKNKRVHTLLGRARCFPPLDDASLSQKCDMERAAMNTPVQGSAADVVMSAMLEISKHARLRELGWRLLLQVRDEVILEGPTESAEEAKAIVVECMSKPFDGNNILKVDLSVDAKFAQNWYSAKVNSRYDDH